MPDPSPAARPPLAGGCQCGAVRYALSAMPTNVNICHCRMCQKASGGPFMAFGGVPADRIEWTRGRPSLFRSSNYAERGFCAACGTPLTYQSAPHRISITLGSLDDPGAVRPAIQLGIESRVPWATCIGELPGEATYSWMKVEDGARLVSHQHPDHDT